MTERLAKSGKRATGRVFVDANTIVSGLLFDGNEALLLDLGAAHLCELVTSEYVLEEVKRTFAKTEFSLTMDEQAFLVSYLHRCVRVYPSPSRLQVKKRAPMLEDQRDIPVVTSYAMLRCDFLVTGDKEMLRKVKGAKRTKELLKMLLGRQSDHQTFHTRCSGKNFL